MTQRRFSARKPTEKRVQRTHNQLPSGRSDTMHRLLKRSPRILVVGDLIADHYVMGDSHRISPEAPVPIVQIKCEKTTLGGSGNVVNNLLALGAQVLPVSAVGDDTAGHALREMLEQRGIPCAGILIEPGKQTSRKTRVVVAHQQVVRLDQETTTPICPDTEAGLLRAISDEPGKFDAVLISDYDKGVVTPSLCQAVIAYAHGNCIPVLVDPKGKDGRKYRGATVLTPNRTETRVLTGMRVDDDQSLQAAGAQLRREFDVQYAVITLSEEGLAVCGDRLTRIRAAAKEVYDVSGAGDTVLAVMGYALASQLPILDAARLANLAAGIAVSKSGAATVTWEEIEAQQYSSWQGPRQVVRSQLEMETIAAQLRSSGRRLVFTNGCFDILHRGHVEYLKASRECGDVLIVAVNTDASIRRIKGPGRPMVGEHDRVALLAALRDVDYVVMFDEDTPYNLIRRLQPHVITKGADYERHEVVGNDLVEEVRLIPLVADRSTTQTIRRIKEAA
jgi:D-beta-D-heptose 7-phosphate kinase/D-beta-D-heptose 1-phosphate adenosyltransferase